jgi:hypothetical protein
MEPYYIIEVKSPGSVHWHQHIPHPFYQPKNAIREAKKLAHGSKPWKWRVVEVTRKPLWESK